jgi:hypothetical protein
VYQQAVACIWIHYFFHHLTSPQVHFISCSWPSTLTTGTTVECLWKTMPHGTDRLIRNSAENTLHYTSAVNFFPKLLLSSYVQIKQIGCESVYWIVVAGYFEHNNTPAGIYSQYEATNSFSIRTLLHAVSRTDSFPCIIFVHVTQFQKSSNSEIYKFWVPRDRLLLVFFFFYMSRSYAVSNLLRPQDCNRVAVSSRVNYVFVFGLQSELHSTNEYFATKEMFTYTSTDYWMQIHPV